MTVARASISRREQRTPKRHAKIARRVAAVAGAAGAAVAGDANAEGITYVPTAGVVAAQGIPGFSFTAPTTVTSGTLRPPSSAGNTGWDIDGNSQADFNLQNNGGSQGFLIPQSPFGGNPNGLLLTSTTSAPLIRPLANAAPIGPLVTAWDNNGQAITFNGIYNLQGPGFLTSQPNYFGFRFAFGNNPNDYYYGWASLTIDFSAAGQGYKITEAFYQTTPNTAINVGAVPVPVPEPSSMALLAAGAAGATAWRARKKKQPAAE
jgi:hypothetical protein